MSKLEDGRRKVVSVEQYEMLMARNHFLNCLEASGVDNWEGYEVAKERYKLEAKADDTIITVRGGIASKGEVGQAG